MTYFPWWLSTIFYGVFGSAFNLANQQLKGNPRLITIYYGIGNFLLMLPFMVLLSAPKSPAYYMLILATGFIIFFEDRRSIQTTGKYGSIISATFSPLSTPIMTLVWWILNPLLFWNLLMQFDKFVLTLMCVATPVVSIFAFNYYDRKKSKNLLNKDAFRFFLPCIIMGIMQSIAIKYALIHVDSIFSAIVYTSGFISLINGMLNLIALISENQSIGYKQALKQLKDKHTKKAGLYALLFLTLFAFFKYYSIKFTPNPAYIGAITISIGPIMTIIFNKWKKVESKVNYALTTILVLSSLILILISFKK